MSDDILSPQEEAEMLKMAQEIRERPRRPKRYIAEGIKGRGGPTSRLFTPEQIETMQLDVVTKNIELENGTIEKKDMDTCIHDWAVAGYPVARIADAMGSDRKQVYRIVERVRKRGLPSAKDVLGL